MISEEEATRHFRKIQVPFLFTMRETTIITGLLECFAQNDDDKEISELLKKIRNTTNEALMSSAKFLVKQKTGEQYDY